MISPEISAVLFAGGKGNRMGELGKHTQKCLLPFEGKPILDHIIDKIVNAFGSARIIICVGYKSEDVIEHYKNTQNSNLHLEFVLHKPGDELKKAFLTTEDLVKKGEPILVGPGNIIARSDLYLSIMTLLIREKATAILSLSDNKKEATTHDVVEIKTIGKLPNSWEYGLVHKIKFPPPKILTNRQLTDLTIYAMNYQIYKIMKTGFSPDQFYISPGIAEILRETGTLPEFMGIKYPDCWLHFEKPSDLTTSREWYNKNEIIELIKEKNRT